MDLARYRALLDEALAVPRFVGTPFIVTISALAGEHRLGGDLGVRLRKLHDLYCHSELSDEQMRAELQALRDLPEAELRAASKERRIHAIQGRLDPGLAAMHLSMCEGEPEGDDFGWTALYGPAYLLGWTELVGAERDLFTLPLTLGAEPDAAELRKAAAEALKRARYAYETLDVDLAGLDYGSRDRFRWSWCNALFRASEAFDRSRKGPPKKAKKPKPPPDLGPSEDKLVEKTVAALAKWAKQNPGAELAQVGFDGTPPYANVGICFDTAESFANTCRAVGADTLASRRQLTYSHWNGARRSAGSDPWLARHDVSEMSDHYFAEIKLDAKYTAYARSEEADPSWAEGVQRILFTRALDRLADQGAFDSVRRAPVLHLVYALHDDAPVLVRMI
jgi:hypothetical protein